MENYISSAIKEKGLNLVDVARNTKLNYHTLKSQLRNKNLGGDSLMKISCFLGLNLNDMKENLYGDLNSKWNKVNNSEYLQSVIIPGYLFDELEPLFIEIHDTYGEDVARKLFRIDGCIQLAYYNINSINEYIDGIEYNAVELNDTKGSVLRDKINEYMYKAILLAFDMPEHKAIDKLFQDNIDKILKINKKDFKGLKSLYEHSIFRKNRDIVYRIAFGTTDIPDSEVEEHDVSKILMTLAEMSADGYSSSIKDFFDIVEIVDSWNIFKMIEEDPYKAKEIAEKLFTLCESVDKALKLSEVNEFNSSIIKRYLADVIISKVGTFDTNILNEDWKVISKEIEEKYLEYCK